MKDRDDRKQDQRHWFLSNAITGMSIYVDRFCGDLLMMQAHSFLLGGIPMLFYGDEAAYTNDYSYLDDLAQSYDNRWMHRPMVNWEKNVRDDSV
jgi:amylosucrase